MKYWDSSALVPLLVQDPATTKVRRMLADDSEVLTWWATRVEAASALARMAREGALDPDAHQVALGRLEVFAAAWDEVVPTDLVREQAARLLRVHPLRTADALQLAAAVVASEQRPATLTVVTLDDRLRQAALREGFGTLPDAGSAR